MDIHKNEIGFALKKKRIKKNSLNFDLLVNIFPATIEIDFLFIK